MLKKIIFACCLFCVASIASASADDSSMPREIVENFYHDYLVASEMPDMESADKLTQKLFLNIQLSISEVCGIMMNRVLIILSMLRIFVKNGKTALMWKLFQRMTVSHK